MQRSSPSVFHPAEHLVTLKTADGPKVCYPFWWQLYEFRLAHPDGEIAVEVVRLESERDFVLVKVTAHSAEGYGTGLASGSLTLVDEVTARAKSQALLDMGIGCAWPILFRDELERADVVILATETQQAPPVPSSVQAPSPSPQSPSPDEPGERSVQIGVSAPTVAQVRALFARAYRVKTADLEARWHGFKLRHLRHEVADAQLSAEELRLLCAEATQQYQRVTADKVFAATDQNGHKPEREVRR